jgi:hypothetical protein
MLTLIVFCFIGRDNDHFTGGKDSVLAKPLSSRVLSLLRVIPPGVVRWLDCGFAASGMQNYD